MNHSQRIAEMQLRVTIVLFNDVMHPKKDSGSWIATEKRKTENQTSEFIFQIMTYTYKKQSVKFNVTGREGNSHGVCSFV